MSAIVVGYMTVDAEKCAHNTTDPHHCVHDWRVTWGNVEKTGGTAAEAL